MHGIDSKARRLHFPAVSIETRMPCCDAALSGCGFRDNMYKHKASAPPRVSLAVVVDHSSARDCATKRTVFPRSYTALRQRNARLCAPGERLLFMHPLGTPLLALRNRLSAMRRSVAGVFPLGIAARMTIALGSVAILAIAA